MSEYFFSEFGLNYINESANMNIMYFHRYADQLPDLSGYTEFIGDGADGSCYLNPLQGSVLKFGIEDGWRIKCDKLTNVLGAQDLINRLDTLLSLKEVCLPEVYGAAALNDELYFIEMEYLPFPFFSAPNGVKHFLSWRNQNSGELMGKVSNLDNFTGWREWLESYRRLQVMGYHFRDFHLNNLRLTKQRVPKFIDLESFVHYIDNKQMTNVA